MDISIINVSPSKADQLLSMRWNNQRVVNNNHVVFLASEMNRGRYEPSSIELVKVMSTGEDFMIDGQHALLAIKACGKSQAMILKQRYAQEADEIPYLFSRIDVHRRRSIADSLRAFGMNEKVSYLKSHLNKTVAAINLIKSEFGTKSRKEYAHEDMIKDVLEWDEFAKVFYDIFQSTLGEKDEKRRFTNSPVVAVGFALIRYVEEFDVVSDFLRGFIHGTNLPNEDPRLLARKKYLTNFSTEGQTIWKTNQTSRLIAWAWNKHYRGESAKLVRIFHLNKRLPLELLGTKYYTGRQV